MVILPQLAQCLYECGRIQAAGGGAKTDFIARLSLPSEGGAVTGLEIGTVCLFPDTIVKAKIYV